MNMKNFKFISGMTNAYTDNDNEGYIVYAEKLL